jgi:choline/ethanolamine kinase
LTTGELANHQISLKIAEKMSEIHSLDIPVSKEPDWLFLTINRWLNNVDTIMNDIRNNNNNQDDSQDLPTKLSKIDFRKEAQWLRKVIEAEAYPVVFCHNDLQEGNILFRQNNLPFAPPDSPETELNSLNDLSPLLISNTSSAADSSEVLTSANGNSRKRSLSDNSLGSDAKKDEFRDEPELMIIDFEYCAYNYRAFDIANHFLGETVSA